jgi:acetate---CoA ligase (ADP-forming)
MGDNPVSALMNPTTIAVVGASNNMTTMGTIQCMNLLTNGFPGEVMPVHPKEKTVLGKKAYPSISDLPCAPDLAVLIVPTRLVPGMLEELGKIGNRSVVIVSAGFRETGDEGKSLEGIIQETAHKYHMRFLGPNCLGIINTQLPLNLTVGPILDYNGKLGLASQSGTYIAQVVYYLHRNGISLSKAISVGNEVNIDLTDCLAYLGQDEATKAIGLYIEGIRDIPRFLEVAGKVSRIKPVVAQYVGGSKAGAKSSASHTGAMAGPQHLYDALFAQAGIISVDTIEDVYKTGWALATQPRLKGRRIAVLTNSGGPGTGIANTLERCGLDVPEFSPGLQKEISAHLPSHASARNPVDLTFHVDMKGLSEDIPKLLFQSDEIDGLIVHGIMDTGFMELLYPGVSRFMDIPKDQMVSLSKISLDTLAEIHRTFDKPLLASSFFDQTIDNCVHQFHRHQIPVFDSPEKAARAMGYLHAYGRFLQKQEKSRKDPGSIPDEAASIFGSFGKMVDEFEAKRFLQAYGVPVTHEMKAASLDEAKEKAGIIGYPVVLKVCSAEISHKTEHGLVYLNLADECELETAYQDLRDRDGTSLVLVAEMVRGDREFIIGMNRFPGFPPGVMFGMGGIFAEAINDFSIRFAPLTRSDAFDMMESLRSGKLLDHYRGMIPVQREGLADILLAVSTIALHFPMIREIDLNPVMIMNGKPKVADALIVL